MRMVRASVEEFMVTQTVGARLVAIMLVNDFLENNLQKQYTVVKNYNQKIYKCQESFLDEVHGNLFALSMITADLHNGLAKVIQKNDG